MKSFEFLSLFVCLFSMNELPVVLRALPLQRAESNVFVRSVYLGKRYVGNTTAVYFKIKGNVDFMVKPASLSCGCSDIYFQKKTAQELSQRGISLVKAKEPLIVKITIRIKPGKRKYFAKIPVVSKSSKGRWKKIILKMSAQGIGELRVSPKEKWFIGLKKGEKKKFNLNVFFDPKLYHEPHPLSLPKHVTLISSKTTSWGNWIGSFQMIQPCYGDFLSKIYFGVKEEKKAKVSFILKGFGDLELKGYSPFIGCLGEVDPKKIKEENLSLSSLLEEKFNLSPNKIKKGSLSVHDFSNFILKGDSLLNSILKQKSLRSDSCLNGSFLYVPPDGQKVIKIPFTLYCFGTRTREKWGWVFKK